MAGIVDTIGASRIPGPTATTDELQAFVQLVTARTNGYRRRNCLRMWLTHWAYKGAQWMMPPTQLLPADSTGYRAVSIRSRRVGLPQPVDNYIASFVNNESARLGRRQQEPKVTPARFGARKADDAAKLATAVLNWDLKRCHWEQVRPSFIRQFVRSGVGIFQTSIEELNNEQRLLARPGIMCCPACRNKLAGAGVDMIELGMLVENGMSTDIIGETAEGPVLKACPMCGPEAPLQEYQPHIEELGEVDMLGRSFGTAVPLAQPMIEAVPWWEIYPENGGRRVTADKMRYWGRRTVRSIEWCRERFVEVGDLQPDDTPFLMANDPEVDFAIDDDPQGYINGMRSSNADTFVDSVVVREVHILPRTFPTGMESGLSIYVFGETAQLTLTRPYMVRMEREDGEVIAVPRAQLAVAQFQPDGENFYARTAADDMLPIQQDLNLLDAQVADIRDKGMPQIVLKPDEDFYERHDGAGSLSLWQFDSPDPTASIDSRTIFSQPLTGNAYLQERDRKVQALQRLGAPQIETGQHTTGASTATEIAMIAENVQQARVERDAQVDSAAELAFEHMLKLRWAYQATMERLPQDVVAKLAADHVQLEAFEGADIMGQTDVEVDAAAGSDKTALTRAAIERAMGWQLYDLRTRDARDKLLDAIDAPKLDADKSAQLKAAQDAWEDFSATKTEIYAAPVLDINIHDATIWYETLGRAWLEPDARQQILRADWDGVLRAIAGWEDKLKLAIEDDAAQRQLYDGQPPERWGAIYQQNVQVLQAALAAQASLPPDTPVPELPLKRVPAPPIGPDGQIAWAPVLVQDKLLLIWRQMMASSPVAAPYSPATEERDQLRSRLLPMYALIQACRMAAQAQAVAQQTAAAPPAPGTEGGGA